MFENVDRTESLDLPKFDPVEKGEKYREKISKQLDQLVDPFIIAELETYFQSNNFEVLDSKGVGFDNFFYSFKLQYLDTQFSTVYSKEGADAHDGTHDFIQGKDFGMYIDGHSLGNRKNIKECVDAMKKYAKMRKDDERSGLHSILWFPNYYSKFEDQIVQKVNKKLLSDEHKEDLEDALFDFYSEELLPNLRQMGHKEIYVRTLIMNGIAYQWRSDRGLVKK